MTESKKLVCSICGEEVTKRQSYSMGDGTRACKKHQEAQDKAQMLKCDLDKKKAKVKSAYEERREYMKREREVMREPFKVRCFMCHREGVRQDEFFTRMMIEKAKYKEIHGKSPNPFLPTEMGEALQALKGTRVLWFVSWEGENTKIKVSYDLYQMLQIMPTMLLCEECTRKKGFKTMFEQRMDKIPPESFLEELFELGVKFEFFVEPIIDAIAIQEIAESRVSEANESATKPL
jgi:hypothetical protein